MKVYTGNPKALTRFGTESGKELSFSLTEWSNFKSTTKEYKYNSPKTFYTYWDNAYVTSFPTVVIDSSKRLWAEPVFHFANARLKDQDFWSKLNNIPHVESELHVESFIQEVYEPVIPLFNNGNLFHWVCENLPKLHYVEKYSIPGKILTQPLEKYQRESIEFFPHIKSRIQEVEVPCVLHSPRIYGIPKTSFQSGKVAHWVPNFLRQHMLPCNTKEPFRKLYITRNDALGRRVANEEEIIPVLEQYGIEYIKLSDYSFKDKIKLFSEAKFVTGPHGAGLTNSIWCQPGKAKLLEYAYGELREQNWSSCPASLVGVDYHILVSKSTKKRLPERLNKKKNCDMIVNPQELDKVLSELL